MMQVDETRRIHQEPEILMWSEKCLSMLRNEGAAVLRTLTWIRKLSCSKAGQLAQFGLNSLDIGWMLFTRSHFPILEEGHRNLGRKVTFVTAVMIMAVFEQPTSDQRRNFNVVN